MTVAKIDIRAKPGSEHDATARNWRVWLNGFEITQFIRHISIDAGVGQVNMVTLTLPAVVRTVMVEGDL